MENGIKDNGKNIVTEKKTSESDVEIYSAEFVASLSTEELGEIYKNARHVQIESLKG